jgi:hypothetical protein
MGLLNLKLLQNVSPISILYSLLNPFRHHCGTLAYDLNYMLLLGDVLGL